MFTGIVETQGRVIALTRGEAGARLTIETGTPLMELGVGQSIAVNGVCLTVVRCDGATFTTDLSSETLGVTTLGDLKPQDRVNLERPLMVGDRLGGHFVTVHVDGVGRIIRRQPGVEATWMWIGFAPPLGIYLAPKGSIAVDGVCEPDAAGAAVCRPRNAEELAELERLARATAGFSEERGDTFEIASVPFSAA